MASEDEPRLSQLERGPRQVIIDALAARYGGTAYAAIQVAHHLARDAAIDTVVVVARRGSIVANGLPAHPRLQLLALRRGVHLELARRLGWEAVRLPRLMGRAPTSLLTWSGMLPRRVPGRVACYLANPVLFQRGDPSNRLRQWAVARTVGTASHVLVPTKFMASAIAELTHVPVEVVPLGVDHDRFFPATAPGNEILCVGDFYPHKRHDLVLAAWAALPAPRPTLRVIGDSRVDYANYRLMRAHADAYRAAGRIEFESDLPLGELATAYRRARVLVITSEYESFSMPLLEAQASGVPAIVRDLPALRETGGDATTYVESDDAGAWTTELARLLNDDHMHRIAREGSLARAQGYSWTRTAQQLSSRLVG